MSRRRAYQEPMPIAPCGVHQAQVFSVEPSVRSSTGMTTIHKICFIVCSKGPYYGLKAWAFPVLAFHGADSDYMDELIGQGEDLTESIVTACRAGSIHLIGGKRCWISVSHEQVSSPGDLVETMAIVRHAGVSYRGQMVLEASL